jgi:flavin-dependent dehydrogenase
MSCDADSCDVLIVGGGPAGSTCARELVAAGLDVCVMDKSVFPRDKVCAGWITPQIVSALDLDLDDYRRTRILQAIDSFAVGAIAGATTVVAYDETVSYAVRRCEFDDYLLSRSGARLRLGEPVRTIERRGGDWLVNGELAARMIVGAGGHFCPVARMLGADLGDGESIIAAQEVEIALDPRRASACGLRGNQAELFFCADLRGYGWCVRKADVINVGLGREENHGLSEHVHALWEWLEREGRVPTGLSPRFKGHAYLLYAQAERALIGDRALLIGDAAGLAYPQSGEGIRPAVESALMAAETISAARGDWQRERLEGYVRRLEGRFGKRAAAHASPDARPGAWRAALGRRLLSNRLFARHVLLDSWFLHRGQAALEPAAARA